MHKFFVFAPAERDVYGHEHNAKILAPLGAKLDREHRFAYCAPSELRIKKGSPSYKHLASMEEVTK
jgi:hypothetical protein